MQIMKPKSYDSKSLPIQRQGDAYMNELVEQLRLEFKDEECAYTYVDEFLNAAIATQIKVIREQRGLSQEQLAEKTGMKQERISVLEDVNYGSWSVTTLKRIARALGVTLKV